MKKILLLFFVFISITTLVNAAEITIYADYDGYVGINGSPWATIQAAETGNYVDTTDDETSGTNPPVAGKDYINPTRQIGRSFFRFDTSSLSGAVITSVDFYFYGIVAATPTVVLQEGTQGDTITTADFDAFTGSSLGTVQITATGLSSIELNSTDVINTAGNTYLCLREYTYDYLNSDPGVLGGAGAHLRFSEYTETSSDPKIVLNYYIPTISGTLKNKESDVSGSAIDYFVVVRSDGSVVGSGTSASNGTYSVNVSESIENDIYMLDLTSYLSKCIGEQVTGVVP